MILPPAKPSSHSATITPPLSQVNRVSSPASNTKPSIAPTNSNLSTNTLPPEAIKLFKRQSGEWLPARVISVQLVTAPDNGNSTSDGLSTNLNTNILSKPDQYLNQQQQQQNRLWQAIVTIDKAVALSKAMTLDKTIAPNKLTSDKTSSINQPVTHKNGVQIQVLSHKPLLPAQILLLKLNQQQQLMAKTISQPRSSIDLTKITNPQQSIIHLAKQNPALHSLIPSKQLFKMLSEISNANKAMPIPTTNKITTVITKIMDKALLIPNIVQKNIFIKELQHYVKTNIPQSNIAKQATKITAGTSLIQPQDKSHTTPSSTTKIKSASVSKPEYNTQDLLKQLLQELTSINKSTFTIPNQESFNAIGKNNNPFNMDAFEKLITQILQKNNTGNISTKTINTKKNEIHKGQLLQWLKQTIARNIFQQVNSQSSNVNQAAQTNADSSYIHLDIPIRYGDQYSQVELIIRQEEQSKDSNKKETEKYWQVFLEFDLATLGLIQARIQLQNDITNVEFWSESKHTQKIIQNKMISLTEQLQQNDIHVHHIHSKLGQLKQKPFQMHYQMVDIKT